MLYLNDELKLTLRGAKYPYYCIKLTPEQVKEIGRRNPVIGMVDGKSILNVKDKGVDTGEACIYVIFE